MNIMGDDFDLNFYKNTLKYSTLPDISEETSPQSDKALLWVSYKVAEEVVSSGSVENIDTIQKKWLDNMKSKLKKEVVEDEEVYVKPPIQDEVIVEDTPSLPPKEIVEEIPAWKPPLESIDTIVDNTGGIVYKDAPQQSSSFVEQETEKYEPPERRVLFGGRGMPPVLEEPASEYPDIYDVDPNSNPNMIYYILMIIIFIFVIKKS